MNLKFDARSIEGLEKVGDVLCPKNGEFPSFRETGCAKYFGRIAKQMNPDDRQNAAFLFTLFSFLPLMAIQVFFMMVTGMQALPGPVGDALRLIDTGVKAIVFGLYYSNMVDEDKTSIRIYDLLGWDAHVSREERRQTTRGRWHEKIS